MKKLFIILIFSSISSSFAHSVSYPYKINIIKEATGKNTSKNLAEYNVFLSNDSNILDVKTNSIVLCSKKECYSSKKSKKFNIGKSYNGKNIPIISYLIPRSEIIESIYFESSSDSSTIINDGIKIKNPVNLKSSELPHNVDIFLTLSSGKNNKLTPITATSMFNSSDAMNIFYDPRSELNVDLPYGAKIKIPKHALSEAQVLNISVNDNGSNYPSVDIYPKLQFNIPVTITRKPIDKILYHSLNQLFNEKIPNLSPVVTNKTSLSKTLTSENAEESTITIGTSGFISSSNLTSYSSPLLKTSQAMAVSATTCGAELAAKRSELIAKTSQTGVVNIDSCVNKPPYVHIALINKLHPKIKYTIEHGKPLNTTLNIWGTPMYRLSTFANELGPRAIVALNGFTWYGPPGVIANTPGFSQGYVKSSSDGAYVNGQYRPIGINRQQGGTVTENSFEGSSDGNKRVMRHIVGSPNVSFFDAKKVGVSVFVKGPENTVSSSTSIIKDNVCSGGNTDRWSSVGASNQLMVMISTASDKESNSADFCSIYQAFGIQNALRLDGGGSTSMLIDGKLLNPNTGSKRLIFGAMRYITYGLKISH